MFKYKKLFWMGIMLLSIQISAFGQSFVEEVLKAPIQKAISESSEIHLKQLKGDGTQMEMEAVKAKKFPHISFMGGYGYSYFHLSQKFPVQYLPITGTAIFENAIVSDFQTQFLAGGISVRQVIFAGLQISEGVKALEQKAKAERFLAEANKEEVAKEVILTFDQLMLLNEVDKLLKDSEKRLAKEHQKVLKALENGLAIPYDRDKIKLAILELEEKQIEADGNKAVLYAKLQYLTDMEKGELESIGYLLQPFLINKEGLSTDNRVELKALESGKKANEHVYKKEKGGRFPTVFAFGNVSYFNAFNSSLTFRDAPVAGDVKLESDRFGLEPMAAVGVGLKWDLFQGGAHNKKLKQAEIDLEISEIKLEKTRKELELLFHKNKADLETSEKKVGVAKQKLKMAKNNLNLATKQYDAGLIDLTERLASENQLYKVNLNYFRQILNQRSAAVELLLGTGELLQTINIKNEK
ncbi:TolC family protein [Aequorivita marina]|uniref:TolC family protein n=1 Tax=Aequorivita marina TaxID=3073654 RepID=UPI0028741449|nr:TolC family protein [Aequorivita sp. S2608]MDS1299732.1 TolC family protein [Aequorivita sp. S2608]